jgi:hypothetical protein
MYIILLAELKYMSTVATLTFDVRRGKSVKRRLRLHPFIMIVPCGLQLPICEVEMLVQSSPLT